MKFGFIILRHIRTIEQNALWIESYKCIRKLYPETMIMIIDDNSNYSLVNNDNVILKNTFIVQSEYPGRGELLPYYYLYKYPIFDCATFIHDSCFMQNKIDYTSIPEKIKFLWYFDHRFTYNEELTRTLLSKLGHSEKLIDFHDNHKNKWISCFGTMTFMHREYICHLQDKYNFFNLLGCVKCREDRCCLERVLGVLCCYTSPYIYYKPPLLGDIHEQLKSYRLWAYHNCFKEYLEDKKDNKLTEYIIVKMLGGDR